MGYLKELDKNIDSRPFTGIRKIEENKIVCKGKAIPDNWFSPSSMIGSSREVYYSNLKKWGLTPEKEYTAIKIEGHGDVFDICIKENDNGEEAWHMSIFFEIL